MGQPAVGELLPDLQRLLWPLLRGAGLCHLPRLPLRLAPRTGNLVILITIMFCFRILMVVFTFRYSTHGLRSVLWGKDLWVSLFNDLQYLSLWTGTGTYFLFQEMNLHALSEERDSLSDDCDSGNDEPSDYFPLERGASNSNTPQVQCCGAGAAILNSWSRSRAKMKRLHNTARCNHF